MLAVLAKEFIQMRRDRLTFAMMVGIPIAQLVLFGYAINTDPRHLPTLVEMGDSGPATRALIEGMRNSGYFDLQGVVDPGGAGAALASGRTMFVVSIPPLFEEKLARGERPQVMLDICELLRRDQIRLVQQKHIRKSDLLPGLRSLLQFLLHMAGIHHCDDGIQADFIG